MDRGSPDPRDRGVTITDIDIPFWRIVAILIKWVLAAIPAYIVIAIIIGAIVLVVTLAIGLIFGDAGMMMQEMFR